MWTSAGVTAGIDLALALVEDDLGRALALDVARELVVFLKRPGGQAQFSATLSLQTAGDRFGELHAWIAENMASDLSIATLAERAGMSERSFVRHYRAQTGVTPARAIDQLRLEAARRLLGDTAFPIKRVAALLRVWIRGNHAAQLLALDRRIAAGIPREIFGLRRRYGFGDAVIKQRRRCNKLYKAEIPRVAPCHRLEKWG